MKRGLLRTELEAFLTALSFFTRVPTPKVFRPEESLLYLPLVGLLLGLLLSGLALLLSPLPHHITALLVCTFQYGLANYFHFDGFVDTMDALFVYDGPRRRLEVLKTPELGAMGLLAGFFLLSGNLILVAEALRSELYGTLALKPVFGRTALLLGIVLGKPAKPGGLGALFLSKKAKRRAALALALSGIPLLVLYPLSCLLTIILLFSLNLYFNEKFEGLTGDHLGFFVEFFEFLFLLVNVSFFLISL